MERLRTWIRTRPIAWTAGLLAGGLLIGGLVGYSGTSELEDERDALEAELVEVEGDRDALAAQVDDALGEAEDARERARTAYRDAKERAQKQFSQRRRSLDQREERLADRAAELDQAEERQLMQVISEDGIWESGVDFEPATYRSSGRRCYWAKLTDPSGEFDSIIANGNGANQTVTIDSPWFETARCGEWRKVGG